MNAKPFNELSTHEKLDAVLAHINDLHTKERADEHKLVRTDSGIKRKYTETEYEIARAVNYKWGNTYGNEVQLILDYLVKVEKYVRKEPNSIPAKEKVMFYNGYSILYAGKVFIESGGYVAKNERDLREMNTAKRLESYMGIGAMGAALFSGLYLSWTVFAYGLDHHWWCFCWFR